MLSIEPDKKIPAIPAVLLLAVSPETVFPVMLTFVVAPCTLIPKGMLAVELIVETVFPEIVLLFAPLKTMP